MQATLPASSPWWNEASEPMSKVNLLYALVPTKYLLAVVIKKSHALRHYHLSKLQIQLGPCILHVNTVWCRKDLGHYLDFSKDGESHEEMLTFPQTRPGPQQVGSWGKWMEDVRLSIPEVTWRTSELPQQEEKTSKYSSDDLTIPHSISENVTKTVTQGLPLWCSPAHPRTLLG